jgi:hypothetical protein
MLNSAISIGGGEMDFIDELRALAARIPQQLEHLRTEEGTKHALVMPFINALGYNIFDPTEVTPEFVADVGIKKGEKVDYVILKDGKPIILFECKGFSADLDKEHPTQLYRYFSVSETRFAVLTNGISYRFFTDLEKPNKLDTKPFFEFNMLDIRESNVEELKRFTKLGFDLEQNLAAAVELKYTKEIKRIFSEQMTEPSGEFVRLFAKQVYPGHLTSSVLQLFAEVTKRALHQFVSDRISERLNAALAGEKASNQSTRSRQASEEAEDVAARSGDDKEVVTTEEELEAFYIVKSILREAVDIKRVHPRDTVSYFGVLLDNNNRKPICRLRFNSKQKYISLIGKDKQEERLALSDLNDIYNYADRLKQTITYYESPKAAPAPAE